MLHLRLPRLLVRPATRLIAPLVIALVVALLPLVAHAGTITVDGTTCKLPDAITAANTDTATKGCTKGSGTDTLLLGGLTHSLATGPYDYGGLTATPGVTSKIVISGGVGGAIVERSGAAKYRLFHVAEAGDLTLQRVTVRRGDVEGYGGGAIYNQGELTLHDSTIIANTGRWGGGIYNDGILTANHSDFISNTAPDTGGGIVNFHGTVILTNSDLISNTARDGGGIHNTSITNSSDSLTSLTNTRFISNTATGRGGGLSNVGGTFNVSKSEFIANRADSGGGLANVESNFMYSIAGTAFITNTLFISNTAGDGGGLFNRYSSATVTDGNFIANTATGNGGAFYNYYSTATVSNTDFIANTAEGDGGGLHNEEGTSATLTNSDFISNTASGMGGGLNNKFYGNATIITESDFIANTAAFGGGIAYQNGTLTATQSDFIANTAGSGGGLYLQGTTAIITKGEIRANIAITSGGGLYQGAGKATIISGRLLDNEAGDTGSAVQQTDGQATVSYSCIVNNTDTAVNDSGDDPIDAANNWWGAPDGPSGVGSGSGDSVSDGVTTGPILTNAPANCYTSILFTKHPSTSGNLLPGQPVAYTLTVTNADALNLKNVHVSDALPTDFDLLTTQTAEPAIGVNGSSFVITDLLASQVATITLVGQVNPTLSDDTVLTNTATLTNALTGPMTATVSNNVLVPRVGWAQEAYETSADSDTFTATVTVSPTNPYISVTVQVVITDSITAVVAAEVQEITFPPGSSSQPVVVTVADGEADGPRTIQLGLQSPVGVSLGDGSGANTAIIITDGGQIFLPHVQR